MRVAIFNRLADGGAINEVDRGEEGAEGLSSAGLGEGCKTLASAGVELSTSGVMAPRDGRGGATRERGKASERVALTSTALGV